MLRAAEESEPLIFPSKESLQNHLVVAIKEYVEEHLEEEIRVSDLCYHLGYSKTYLSRLFHEMSGDTIASYVVLRKVHRAKAMIRGRRMNFSEISERLSFSNPQYFSRVFKRVTGMTPSEFKQTLER